MSAFQCSDLHLSTLAKYAVAHDLDRNLDAQASFNARAQQVYRVLAQANIDSLDERYPREDFAMGEFKPDAAQQPALNIIKLCHCYAYQACETRTWGDSRAKRLDSRAKRLVDDIEAHAVRHLPGYGTAPWGI